MLLAAVGLVVQGLWSFSAAAELVGRLPTSPEGTDYQAWYDDELDLTFMVDGAWLSALGASVDGEVDWPTLVNRLGFLTIDGLAGWRLPALDVNGDGVVVDCAAASDACPDNELQHFYLAASAMRLDADQAEASDAPDMPPDYYWTGSDCPTGYECRLAFGMFGPGGVTVRSHVANTHRVIVVRPGDVGRQMLVGRQKQP
jgi:hypothetical protein